MTDDIAAFIRARLDEDEQGARALEDMCRTWRWTVPTGSPYPQRVSSVGVPYLVAETYDGPQLPAVTAPFIARHDPARVLRGVEAKRRIVDDLLPQIAHADELVEREWGSNDDCAGNLARLLASEWSDHPDYRKEWTP